MKKVWRFYAEFNGEMKVVSIVFDNQRRARLEQTKLEKKFKNILVEYFEKGED